MRRRSFLKKSLQAGAVLALPVSLPACTPASIRFGLIADVHKDIMHDASDRLQAFIDEAGQRQLDFIMQLGDFCCPYDHNLDFMKIWRQYEGDQYHVLGNHDTDGGFTREQTMAYWDMKKKYYSFDKGHLHFTVLDGNDPNPEPWSGYHRYIGKEQLDWLRKDLDRTNHPTIIISHQTLENPDGGIANLEEVRRVLEEANEKAGYTKVMASICGHHHTDYHTRINGIYYIQINSASYHWVGGDHQIVRYSEAIDKDFPWIKYTIPYEQPLYTFVEIHPSGFLFVEGKSSNFVGPGPDEMGLPVPPENVPIVPYITEKKLET